MKPIDPEALALHYSAFLRPGRILLTGHSHQAWPDVAREAVLRCYDDAARLVDDKWGAVMAEADAVRAAVATSIGAEAADVALGQNTHELVTRFLSALPWARRRHLVTTDGEFHSMRRQLLRLEEAGVEVTRVAVDPLSSLAERLADAVREDTAALLASTVLFQTAAVVPDLAVAARAAHARGAAVLFDAYHAFMAVPFTVADLGPDPIFVVGGGYKYAQWGEGACWMRVPPGCRLRPVFTGWFSDFAHLDAPRAGGRIGYGGDGARRFAGSTFEPTSLYRAAAVARFFEAEGLDPSRLRAISVRQTGRIVERLRGRLPILSPLAETARGGFVAVRVPGAASLVAALRGRGIYVDSRSEVLRIGPAPYVSMGEIDAALDQVLALATAASSQLA